MTVASTKQLLTLQVRPRLLNSRSYWNKNSELWKSFAQKFAYCYKSASRQVFTILAINYTNFSRSEIHQTRILGLIVFFKTKSPTTFEATDCQLLRSLKQSVLNCRGLQSNTNPIHDLKINRTNTKPPTNPPIPPISKEIKSSGERPNAFNVSRCPRLL